MSSQGSTAERDIVRKLARGSLLSRLKGSRQPLKLAAVPRDHVQGDRQRGEALLLGKLIAGSEAIPLFEGDFGASGKGAGLLQGFSWLRDLAAAASREKGAALAEAVVGKWLLAHGTKVDEAWAPDFWGERILFWAAYAPYILSSGDGGYRSALLNTLARGARHLDSSAEKAPAGLKRVTAWCGVIAAGLLLQGGVSRVARGEAGLGRALASAQFDDGGLISRSPMEQSLLVDRLGLLRSCYFAAKQTIPDSLEAAAAAALAALHGVTMGDGALSSWQGCGPGEAQRLNALIEGCGLRARPLRHARGWGYQRMSALGTVVVIDAAPPPSQKAAAQGSASTLAFELSDGSQRLVVNCGGAGPLPTQLSEDLLQALRTTAAHSTLVLDDTNSTNILPDGSLSRGVEDVAIERSEDNDASRLTASHGGYVRAFGLVHKRSLMLGNDGKELRGADQLVAQGRKKIKEAAGYAVRFHLAPGIEATPTADGMGAILRSKGAPPWNFRCRGGMLTTEESLWIDGRGQAVPTVQLVIVGEVSSLGGEIGWLFRRTS
ncbi:heparinase II/III family protein [Sphingomonas hankyongi]|uniref:Heparinase II/III family protein n=1 Tax=Sphingomonas hankyongi TaxID=2908209 RepID=A0ABT0S503_9SPHN|nr:heparinase II/III family protein [Sphingomonas hankyongi]MCL6730952.1 heparinase II/III family protein [Sphingomonas hankyongi]